MTLFINGKTYDADELIAYHKRLEKENAELKETVLQFQKDSYCGVCHFKTKTQLKQATGIIKEFVDWANWQGSNCPSFKSIQDKAEQFLSEVEKCGQ